MSLAGSFPFCALVGQERLKLGLTLAAIDWRLSCLILGEKGSGKSTAARALAEIMPGNPPFVNVPIGVTEDRLLGGISLDAAFQGTAALQPGLLHAADGGVLYIDEINLLAGPLTDALLDVSATGRYVLERDGFSQDGLTRFVLLGSMNPEEGRLRPQLTDRFALAVEVQPPALASERVAVLKVRAEFDRDPGAFRSRVEPEQARFRQKIATAREHLAEVSIGDAELSLIAERIVEAGVLSLRADLAAVRAASALAAFHGRTAVSAEEIEAVLPLVLLHRTHSRNLRPPQPPPSPPPGSDTGATPDAPPPPEAARIFAPEARSAPALRRVEQPRPDRSGAAELDVFASLRSSVCQTGKVTLQAEHARYRGPQQAKGVRFVFLVDCSGSQAARQRMRAVKGIALGLLKESIHAADEAAVVVFRGSRAEVLVEPSSDRALIERKLEFVPTGGRTPLAHGLQLAAELTDARSCLIVLTDGKANVALAGGDPWGEALEIAAGIRCPALVIDTSPDGAPRLHELARALRAELRSLDAMDQSGLLSLVRR